MSDLCVLKGPRMGEGLETHTYNYNAYTYMKFRFLTFMMLAAGAAVGCTEEMVDPSECGEKTIWAVMDERDVETRTCVSDDKGNFFGVLWCKGDAIGVYSASGTENAKFKAQIEEPAGKAAFKGNFAGTPAYAYYPYNEVNASSNTLKGELPLVQDFSSADGILKYDYKLGKPSAENKDEFNFDHLFSLLRFTINADGTGVAGQNLQKVELTFPDGVTMNSGAFTVPVKGGDIKWGSTTTGRTLTLNWSDTPAMAAGATLTGYLNCPPVTGLKGKAIIVKLTTSSYVVSFNATVNIDSFAAGYVYSFPLTLSKWEDKSGSNYKEEQLVRPSLTSLSFTAADNAGKILAKKLYYNQNKSKKNSAGKTFYGFTDYYTAADKTTQTMTIDEEAGTITGCIPYLYDRNLVPTVGMTSGASLQYSADGTSFSDWDGKSAIDFGVAKIIRVTKNGMSHDYAVEIKNTGLPVLVINQPGGDTEWDHVGTGKILWSKETEFDALEANYPGTIALYNADGTSAMIDKSGAIVEGEVAASVRLRGNTSQNYPKKPFAVKFGSKQGISVKRPDGRTNTIPAHKRWVLLANWKDKSLIRNHIAFGIARLFTEKYSDSIPWNVRGEFVEVVYNGVHIGNYYFCEQIKIDENRLDILDPYEVDEKNPFTGDWTDYGYLLESDDYYDEPAKFTTNHCIPFMFKDDVDGNNVILNAVKSKIIGIETNIYNGYKYKRNSRYGAADGFTKAYADLDLPSFVDQLLIYEMTMNAEFRHPKSLYTYIDHYIPEGGNKEDNPKYGKLCAGPVWDFDFETFPTLGQSWVEVSDRSYTAPIITTSSLLKSRKISSSGYSSPTNGSDSPFMWWPLLIKDDTFTQTAADRWNSIKGDILTYAGEIKYMQSYLAESWKQNNDMWPACYDDSCDRHWVTSSGFCGDEYMTSFDEVYNAFYSAYTNRLNGMNTFVSNKNWSASSWDSYISYK